MKRRLWVCLLAACLMLSMCPFSTMAVETGSYQLLVSNEDFSVYTGTQYPWRETENGGYISNNTVSEQKTISSLKIVFHKDGVVNFDWSTSGASTDYLAYRVSTEDYTDIKEFTGQSVNKYTGEKVGTEEALTVSANDTLYVALARYKADSTGTATISNLSLESIYEGEDPVVTDHVLFDESMGTVSVDWMEVKSNFDNTTYYRLSASSVGAVKVGETYRLKATATGENQFYGWVREYMVNGKTKYELLPMKYYTLKTKDSGNSVIINTQSAVSNPELEVTLDGKSAYRAVFAPKGTYVLRKNAEFFDSNTDVASIINNASAGDVIEILQDLTLTGDVTVPKNVLLYVPFRSGWSEDDVAGLYRAGGYGTVARSGINTTDIYMTLTVQGSLEVNGTLAVGSVVGSDTQRMQGHISGTHGRIVNNGIITVNSGGTMTCYGLVEGSGTVHVNDGGVLREMFIVGDFAGGSNTAELFFSSQMPFKRFAMQRVQCTLTMDIRSKLMAMMSIWANSMYNEAEVVLFGDDSTAAFYPTSSKTDTVGLTRTYHPERALIDGNGILDVSNVGRTVWTFSNGLKFQPLTISLGGISVDTGNSDFTIPYNFKIVLVGGEYDIPLGMRIMPGAEIVVESGASVNIGGRLMVMDGLIQSDILNSSGCRYPTRAELEAANFSGSGELIINGTLTMETGATLGGVVKTGGTGKLVIEDNVFLNNSGDLTKLDPAKDLSDHPYDQYTAEGGIYKDKKVHNWVQQDGALGEYDENTTWFNLPARIYMNGELHKVEAGKTYLGAALDAAETVTYPVDYLYVADGVFGSLGNSKYGYLTNSGHREMTWATETVSRVMTGVWVDSEASEETVEVTECSVAGFANETVKCTAEKSGTSTLLKDLVVVDEETEIARTEKFVFLVKFTTEGNLDGYTVQPVDGVYTIPPEANGVKIEACMLGDVTADGYIAVDDANMISLYLAKKVTLDEFPMLAADVNGDGYIAVDDANGISLHLAKKILIFPVS